MTPSRTVSIVLATHNRPDALAHTLDRLAQGELRSIDHEIVVVDNASDKSAAGIVAKHKRARLIQLTRNLGSCAKALGVASAAGRVVMFLDDDSHPREGAVTRMLERFDADAGLGAAGFRVFLPDGREESSALPYVFVGCGVGFRAEALRDAGGLDATFFMQAEEYDLTFRLYQQGWKAEVFADLAVEHLKTPAARRAERTTYLDVRNNLRLIARYLPEPMRGVYARDWMERYAWMAEREGHSRALGRARWAGWWRGLVERTTHGRWRLDEEGCEHFFRWAAIECRMRALQRHGIGRVVLADVGKNSYAFVRGAREAGLDVPAIADDAFAAAGRLYRGVPVITTAKALELTPDAVVVSNMSYAHAIRRCAALRAMTRTPVVEWSVHPRGGDEEGAAGISMEPLVMAETA